MSKNYLILMGFVVLAAGFLLGFLYSYQRSGTYKPPSQLASAPQVLANTSPLFKSQTAMVEGKVVEVGENSLTVEGLGNGKEQFPVSNKFVVYVPVKNTRTATASSQLKLVEKDKDSLIVLELIEGKYQVVSVSYIPR